MIGILAISLRFEVILRKALMDLITQTIRNNFDFVFFVYGLAFIVLGLAVLFQTNKASELRIAKIFWLLGAFGIIHGCLEWLQMWSLIKGIDIKILNLIALIVSFIFLFEFGRRLLLLSIWVYPSGRFYSKYILNWTLILALLATVIVVSSVSSDFMKISAIMTRYLIAFPGCLLTGEMSRF